MYIYIFSCWKYLVYSTLVMFVKVIWLLREESLFCPQLTYSNSSPKKKKKTLHIRIRVAILSLSVKVSEYYQEYITANTRTTNLQNSIVFLGASFLWPEWSMSEEKPVKEASASPRRPRLPWQKDLKS